MLCKKGTPHCCDAPLFGQGSQNNGKQLPLKLLVLPRHRQPGVTAKSTQGSATLRLGLCRIPIPYGSVTVATFDLYSQYDEDLAERERSLTPILAWLQDRPTGTLQ